MYNMHPHFAPILKEKSVEKSASYTQDNTVSHWLPCNTISSK